MYPVSITTKTQGPPIILGQNTPPASASFSTESCFLWLHRKNTAFSMNLRGMVNHEYNRLLTEKGLVSNLIPGGEDFNQLGMDRKTSIVRPDLYFAACHKVISVHTGTPFDGLNLSTAAFFDLLHEQNVKCSANVRGLINQRYNQLLSEVGINEGKIPGKNPEQLGMDKSTSLRAELYAKAYGEVIARFEQPIWHNSDCMPFKNIDIFRHSLQFMGCSDIFLCAQVCKVWNQSSNYLNQPQYGPFKSADIFRHTAQFLEYGDIFLCAQVCKAWNGLSKRLNWQQFFKNEGIPLVEEEKGKESNYKGEFRILYPMTISGRMSEKLFGNFHEEIPCISRAIFNKCYRPDPFELGKLMMHTFKIVVIPAFFERTSSAEFPFILDSKGDLQPVGTGEWTGEKLQIPNGIKNLKILCENPLAGKENLPVFSYFYDEILQQCKTCPDKISLCFMRTCIADESRNLPYQNQKALVEGRGFEVTSLRDRIFFDAVCILTSGTCPDARDSHWSFARTSDIIVLGNSSYQLGIGGFAPRAGADVHDNNYDDDFIGVVPGVPAEVLR